MPTPDPAAAFDLTDRVRNAEAAVSVLRQVVSLLGRIQGRRKSLIYMGEGIDIDPTREAGSPAIEEMRDFVATAARNDVHVYTIDPRGLDPQDEVVDAPVPADSPDDPFKYLRTLNEGKRASIESVRDWAEQTGGVSVVATNDLDAGLERIVRENSRYYALGYYATANTADGRFHRIEVRVTRAGLTVRAQRGYVANRQPPGSEHGSAAKTPPVASALDQALALPVEDDSMRLRASAVPFLRQDGKQDLVVAIVVDGRDIELARDAGGRLRGAIEFRLLAFDQAGRLAAGRKASTTLTIQAAGREAFESNGVGCVERLDLKPGRYRLRIGAGQPEGSRAGVLQADIEVPALAAQPLEVSGLLVGSNLGRPSLKAPDVERYKRWLPTGATAERRFSAREQLAVFAEIYENAPLVSILVTTQLLNDRNAVVLESNAPLERDPANGGRNWYLAHVPLDGISPGRYRLRVNAFAPGTQWSTSRELSFDVTSQNE